MSEIIVVDSSSEEAKDLYAAPSSDVQGAPTEPSDAASGDGDHAPCNEPVLELSTSIEADPVALEPTTEAVGEGPAVAPNDALGPLRPWIRSPSPAIEIINAPMFDAGVSDTQRIDYDKHATVDTEVAPDVVASAPVADVLPVDTSNLPPEIEYEEEVWGDDIDESEVAATTSDAVVRTKF